MWKRAGEIELADPLKSHHRLSSSFRSLLWVIFVLRQVVTGDGGLTLRWYKMSLHNVFPQNI